MKHGAFCSRAAHDLLKNLGATCLLECIHLQIEGLVPSANPAYPIFIDPLSAASQFVIPVPSV